MCELSKMTPDNVVMYVRTRSNHLRNGAKQLKQQVLSIFPDKKDSDTMFLVFLDKL